MSFQSTPGYVDKMLSNEMTLKTNRQCLIPIIKTF